MADVISVQDFIANTLEDVHSPKTSTFISKIPACRSTVHELEEATEVDRNTLAKIRKSVKNMYKSGVGHAENEVILCDHLDRLGKDGVGVEENEEDNEIGTGMYKFGVVLRDLSQKFRQLMQNLNNIVMFPLDTFLKAELKTDLRKPFDKALKDYDCKYDKIRKEKLQLAKEAGLSKTDVTQQEVAEDLEKERRVLQLQMCEYLIKVNEIKAKKGAELLQHLIDYYHAQTNYLEDSLETMQHFGLFMQDLVDKVSRIKTRHDEQKRRLVNTREELKKLIEDETGPANLGYSLHQQQGNKAHGTRKTGFLLKKSDGKVKRLWQRRRARIAEGDLMLYHADESKAPVRLQLLTCQVKLPVEDDPSKRCFDLISNNRTYHFQVEDGKDREEWISVLNNAKQEVFDRAMQTDEPDPPSTTGAVPGAPNPAGSSAHTSSVEGGAGATSHPVDSSQGTEVCNYGDTAGAVAALMSTSVLVGTSERKAVIEEIKRMPGNDRCCDCDAKDPVWCSVNLGVLICLECCGVHRELGVHYSRTQSLVMDDLAHNQLLLPRFIGNNVFNDVYESTLADGIKPKASTVDGQLDGLMQKRKNFIRAKYVERRFVCATSSGSELESKFLRRDLLHGIRNSNMSYILQVYGEQCDLVTHFKPEDDEEAGPPGETALHVAIATQPQDGGHCSMDGSGDWEEETNGKMAASKNLAIIEFILQNSPSSHLQRTNLKQENALHSCVRFGRTEALKLILKASGVPSPLMQARNSDGETALELATNLNIQSCLDLLTQIAEASIGLTQQASQQSASERRAARSGLEVLDRLLVDWGLTGAAIGSDGGGSPGQDRTETPKRRSISRDPSTSSADASVTLNSFHQQTAASISTAEDHKVEDSNASTPNCLDPPITSSTPGSTARSTGAPRGSHTLQSSASLSAYDKLAESQRFYAGSTVSPGLATLPRKRKGPAPRPPLSNMPGVVTSTPTAGLNKPSQKKKPITSQRAVNDVPSLPHQTSLPVAKPSVAAKTTAIGKRHSIGGADGVAPSRPKLPPKPVLLAALENNNRNDSSTPDLKSPEESDEDDQSSLPLASRVFLRDSSRSDRSYQTLPKGMGGAKMSASFCDSSMFSSPLTLAHRREEPRKFRPASQSGDHIDVLLDVLEEPLPSLKPRPSLHLQRFLDIEEETGSEEHLVPPSKSSSLQRSSLNELQSASSLGDLPSTTTGNSNPPSTPPVTAAIANNTSGGSSNDSKTSESIVTKLPPQKKRVRALYNCEAENTDEVAFKKGEVLLVTQSNKEEEWWEGYIESEPTRRGLFPVTYVELMVD